MGWRDYSVQWLTYFRNGMACTSFSLQEKEKRLERTCGRCERERDGQCQADPGVLSLLVLLLFNLGLGLAASCIFWVLEDGISRPAVAQNTIHVCISRNPLLG